MVRTSLVLALCLPLLGGCIARTAVDVVTAPVRVAGKAVDLATTSQSESDEKRGRRLRERDEELGKLERKLSREQRDCADGERDACREAEKLRDEIDEVMDRPI